MHVLCVHCNANNFSLEKVAHKKNSFGDCCSHEEVALEPILDPPEILRDLFNGAHEKSKHFLQRIRCYNNFFAFSSFNTNLVNINNSRPGSFCFKIHGQVYYQINSSLFDVIGFLSCRQNSLALLIILFATATYWLSLIECCMKS